MLVTYLHTGDLRGKQGKRLILGTKVAYTATRHPQAFTEGHEWTEV